MEREKIGFSEAKKPLFITYKNVVTLAYKVGQAENKNESQTNLTSNSQNMQQSQTHEMVEIKRKEVIKNKIETQERTYSDIIQKKSENEQETPRQNWPTPPKEQKKYEMVIKPKENKNNAKALWKDVS